MLVTTIDSEQATPSLSQAQRMKKSSQEGKLNEDSMQEIMCEQKKPDWDRITLGGEKLRKYFPRSYTPQQIEKVIYHLLDLWQKKQPEKTEQK
jgi:ParB family chromosome partitioning protein